ncbi:MAG: DUF6414 family protein [Telluria sp.]
MHDHSLTLFEARLAELDLVDYVDSAVNLETAPVISKSFVRISARTNFIDAAKITSMLCSFNQIGEAITHVTNVSAIAMVRQEIKEAQGLSSEKGKLVTLRQLEKQLTDTAELAKKGGLYQDPKFLKHLALVTEFGFSDQLEVQQRIGERLYSACLKREYLRESVDLIIRKYSRKTEKKLVVLGVVTQSQLTPEETTSDVTPEQMSMKEAVTNLVNHIAAIESSLSGKAQNEVVIDPIAVYITL